MSKNGIELMVKKGILKGFKAEGSLVAIVPENSHEAQKGEVGVLVLPSEVTSVGMNVFSNLKTLEKVVLPRSVASIGRSAFSGCEKLKSIVF